MNEKYSTISYIYCQLILDLLHAGEDCVIVEIKTLKGLDNSHLAQVIAYLAVSGCSIGLLINFGERSLRRRRVFPPQKVIDHLLNRQGLFIPDRFKDKEEVTGKKFRV